MMGQPNAEDEEWCVTAPDPLTVSVVTYSPGEHLDTFLDSLRLATTRPYRVVLADNGSTDGAPEQSASRPEVTLLRTGSNLGYGGAHNAALVGVTDGWVVLANPDVRWEPGSLDTLLAATARWPRGGAFGPAIVDVDGALYPSARELPTLGRGIGHVLCGWWWPSNPWTASYRRERGEPVEGPAGWLSGSCLLLPAEAFHRVGGFDDSYFMYFEDVDLGARLDRAGWLSVHVPSAVVVHTGGHATARAADRMRDEHHRSAYRYLSRLYPGRSRAPLRWTLAAGLWTRAALSRVIGRVGQGAAPQRHSELLDSETR